MRRGILVVLVVTIAVMLVMAAPAIAKTGTKSGGYWAYSAGAQDFALEIHGGGEYIFADAEHSPHAGYSTTTGKCKVCHAVHGAGIAPDGVLAPSEKLLRSTAANSCTYCHLGAGAFAIDPYASRPTFAVQWSSLTNYYSNDSSKTTGAPIWTSDGLAVSATNQNAANPRSGHNATHGHDNPQTVPAGGSKSYKGCVSCHAVHGANTMTDGALKPNILKNDPAKGTTSQAATGWGTSGEGYGSHEGPVNTQAAFCEDCHDGTKLDPISGADIPIVSQTDFNTYFPSCGANSNSGAACHNSVQSDITESIAQFGAFNNKGHNGRSHIMTTTLDGGIAYSVTGVDSETVYASGNGCATCHNVPKYSAGGPLQQGAVFPHFWPSDELIQNYKITESDGACIGCHAGVGTAF